MRVRSHFLSDRDERSHLQPLDDLGARLLDRFHIGVADVPVLICRCELVLKNPSNEEVARCLGFNEAIDRTHVRRLIARGDQYLRVLVAVLDGHSYPEVATQLGLTRREIELTVRYIEELLRARGFA